MKCFYHPEFDAVGLCKGCHRALCMDCLADVPPGVACRGKCEAEVAAVNRIIEQSKTAYAKQATVHRRFGVYTMLFGVPFLLVGLVWAAAGRWTIAWFPLVMGSVCALWGLASFRSGREIGEVKPPSMAQFP